MSANRDASVQKAARVLACVSCQARKVKCDHAYPCSRCVKSKTQCVPANQIARRRRRRFPERELLDQLSKYERLLRMNNIDFEPLHKAISEASDVPAAQAGNGMDDMAHSQEREVLSPAITIKSETGSEIKDWWYVMRQRFPGRDDESDDSSREEFGEAVVKRALDQAYQNDEHFIFGSAQTNLDLSILHPDPIQIFRLWQLYLDNVNPLLRVIHTPTMQGRIIEAASNVLNIAPILEALMFSIYSMAILSLASGQCITMFGATRSDLLKKYQFACQQALMNCGFLRSNDRDCLTALFLYIVSASTTTDPRTLCSTLGLAVRIAQRMRIENESACASHGVLEGEMRRRLWWALVLFDVRISQLADHKSQTFTPIWDCQIPLNVNDADLRPEMKELPTAQVNPTEAIFAVVRSELGDFVRNSSRLLNFSAPHLKCLGRNPPESLVSEGGEMTWLEKKVEEKYLGHCSLDNALHFMTIWQARSYLASFRLMENHSDSTVLTPAEIEARITADLPHALRMLHCDTKIMTSPLTHGFRWISHYHFPFPAYIYACKYARRLPLSEHTSQIWKVINDHFVARYGSLCEIDHPFFRMFFALVLPAWDARVVASARAGLTASMDTPWIVSTLRHASQVMALKQPSNNSDDRQPNLDSSFRCFDIPPIPIRVGKGINGVYGPPVSEADQNLLSRSMMDINVDALDWTTIDWNIGQSSDW
ncbi:hypothetical protein P154DRAFT_518706 [Amniculicola lignicola CBS 123094]|uniref:Zn(2)-C6 fungal-type domain-containing protein n=1 Tax=Amniculicola lignicola CBS 123094 TaxID=1392246 RepID=A0A6A5WTZ9_9PLEO|nr:hypothetical protein P154DRAFT_518706 [Amniculicola lignicola CBS 123094]